MQREKRIKSGPLLEVAYYPVTKDGRHLPRGPRRQKTTEAQAKYNRKMVTRKIVRLVNANFAEGEDFFAHLTYNPTACPQSEEEARRDFTNFVRRIKTKRRSETKRLGKELAELEGAGLTVQAQRVRKRLKKLRADFKFLYVIESKTYQKGPRKGERSFHFHCFCTGGLTREQMEELWPWRINADTYRPDKFGIEAAGRYISKDPQGRKAFSHSRNLTQPVERVRDGKYTAGQVERWARERRDDRLFWERKFPGYKFVRLRATVNPYNMGIYLALVMYRIDSSPPMGDLGDWDDDEWEVLG